MEGMEEMDDKVKLFDNGHVAIYRIGLDYWIYDGTWELVSWEYVEQIWVEEEEDDDEDEK